VFKGIAEFATESPEIITGEDYQYKAGTLFDQLLRVKINIFNISKINSRSEVAERRASSGCPSISARAILTT
jgi:hypothetical protein